MPVVMNDRALSNQAMDVLRRAGNPFRNYFARNPDDDVCARYHVPELFAREREQLLGVVDLYRYDPTTHSEIVPVLGNKGAGKTHLLHSIKHGQEGAWQLLVTPGSYQKDTNFLEYLLFQVIDTLLSGGKQKGARPLEYVSEELTRRMLQKTLGTLDNKQKMELFPVPGLGKWIQRFGLGTGQAQEKTQWLLDNLTTPLPVRAAKTQSGGIGGSLAHICQECGLTPQRASEIVCEYINQTEPMNTAGLMRRHIFQGFARAALLGDESDLANFLTFGFAELDFKVQPGRQDLVLALFKVMMEVFLHLKIPVVVAFDQLEDLLLARRADDDHHRIAEAFFAGIVQVMHQIDGICFLVFAERGLWNRFVPSLDGYIQDRLNNPVHVPGYGTIKALRLEAPPPELLRRVVEARMRPSLEELPNFSDLPAIFPFSEEQVIQIARTEPTLRDMLQQFRHLFDHLVYGEAREPSPNGYHTPLPQPPMPGERLPDTSEDVSIKSMVTVQSPTPQAPTQPQTPTPQPVQQQPQTPAPQPVPTPQPTETATPQQTPTAPSTITPPNMTATASLQGDQFDNFAELWDQEMRAARRKLEPEGSLTGATRELQSGLGSFLQVCHEHGVKVGPWRMQHVVNELTFGDHPTYGVLTLAHWVCKDGQPWKVGIGLFLAKGAGKPRDLQTKLEALEAKPPMIDHLILMRPEEDMSLTGKTKTAWKDAQSKNHSVRLEAVSLEAFAALYAFPRWITAIGEALPEGQPVPNLADFLQERCEKLLEQVCMPVVP